MMDAVNVWREYRVTLGDADLVFFGVDGAFAEYVPEEVLGLHTHEYYELFYVLRGTNEIRTEQGTLTLSEGDCAVLSVREPHATTCDAQTQRVVLPFSLEKNKQTAQPSMYAEFAELLRQRVFLSSDPALGEAFRRLFRYFYSTYSDKDWLIATCLQEIALLLKASVGREEDGRDRQPLSDSGQYRNYVIEYYFENHLADASLTELARRLHLSTSRTARLVQRLYGRSFAQHAKRRRVMRAAELLTATELSVAQIAAKVGYGSPNNFFVAFKSVYGETPLAYRKRCGNP